MKVCVVQSHDFISDIQVYESGYVAFDNLKSKFPKSKYEFRKADLTEFIKEAEFKNKETGDKFTFTVRMQHTILK